MDRKYKSIPVAILVISGSLLTSPSSLAAATGLQTIENFGNYNGANPYSKMVSASNGLFYGVTEVGFSNSEFGGVIYSFNSNDQSIKNLAEFPRTNFIDPFDQTNFTYPFSSLTLASNGLYYGSTRQAGTNNDGTIYSFNPTNNELKEIISFNGVNGANPFADLTVGNNGILYGTTISGGSTGSGVIFSFDTNTNSLTKIADFDGANGSTPYADLKAGGNGLFYGVTAGGGSHYQGTVYSFDPVSNAITKLADFDNNNGAQPRANLTLGSQGVFYSAAEYGGDNNQGTIYSFDTKTNAITKLVDFNGNNGAVPISNGGLLLNKDGLLYGTTYLGGSSDIGTVFSFDPSNKTVTTIGDFNDTNGANPFAGLTYDGSGTFYGTTVYGQPNGFGSIFKFVVPSQIAVPEPSTIVGSMIALCLGASLKDKSRKNGKNARTTSRSLR